MLVPETSMEIQASYQGDAEVCSAAFPEIILQLAELWIEV
jgi:hypothetical protein